MTNKILFTQKLILNFGLLALVTSLQIKVHKWGEFVKHLDHGLIEIINSLGPSFLEMLSGNQTILYMKNLQPLSGMGLNLADVWKDLIQEKII